jgi:hypothetical protein
MKITKSQLREIIKEELEEEIADNPAGHAMNVTPEQMIAAIREIERSADGGSALIAPEKSILAAFPNEEPRQILGLLADMEEVTRTIESSWFAPGITTNFDEYERAYSVRR